jgi:5'(3')-deoxyribonucleotidase
VEARVRQPLEEGAVTTLFLDMDGVLADFEAGVLRVLGTHAYQYRTTHGDNAFWRDLTCKAPHFYADLPIMPYAQELVGALLPYGPVVLTGAHFRSDPCKVAEADKRQWLAQRFPALAQTMIACRSEDKWQHMRHGDVLVDDRLKYASLWLEAGGKFVYHADPANWRNVVLEVRRCL